MSATILFRTADLTPGNGRTVFGVVMPYGQTATVSDGGAPYRERFAFGAFARSVRERGSKVKLFTCHDTRRLPVGRAVELYEERDGLRAAFEIPETSAGNDALELVRSGVVDSFSIGFRGIREHREGDVVVRDEAALMECSLVGLPAYAGAAIAGVRSEFFIPRAVARAQLSILDW